MLEAGNSRTFRVIFLFLIPAAICLFFMQPVAFTAEQVDQSNLPEWAGGWTNINPTPDGFASMWQTFTPDRPNLMAVEIDILTVSSGQGDDTLTVEIAKDGEILASTERNVEYGFEGLLRFEFAEAAAVIPGELYELKVHDTGATRFGWKYGPNTYERGSRYVFAQERPGTDWFFQTYTRVEQIAAKYSGGTGEPNDPYQIATAADLIALGETHEDYDKHFILTVDIDLDPNLPGRKVFDKAVIAPNTNDTDNSFLGTYFTGVFDGNEHTISNLKIDGTNHLGLFGFLRLKAEIKRLGTLNVKISGSGSCVGGLVGQYGYSGENGGTITDCYSTGMVSGRQSVGGLVGGNYSGNVTKCYSTSLVTGDSDDVGGLVGSNGSSISMSYSTGTVNGTGLFSNIGGLVGENFRGSVTQCYSTGIVNGVGWHSYVGGLVGWNYDSVVIECYSQGVTSGDSFVGGLVGYNNGYIIQCYSNGKVSGEAAVGGLVGGTGNWSGMRDIPGVVIECLWDIQTSGQTASEGDTGKTTAEMQDIQTYLDVGWDFVGEIENGTHETWQIPSEGGYPVLTAFSGYTPPKLQGIGTTDDPYLISDAIELGAMIHYSPDANYRLVASIDLSDIRWGTAVIHRFAGRFDGNNMTISHLTIKGGVYLGLFGRLDSGAKIVNLGVVDVNITGSGDYIGGLVGQIYGESSGVINSYSTGAVSGESFVGGLVGSSESTMTECYTTGTVSSTGYLVSYTGGLVGRNSGTVISCYSTDWVTGHSDVGGLVGWNSGNIITSYSSGPVTGGSSVGGIVGSNDEGSIATSYSTGAVSGIDRVGGLVGSGLDSTITSSFWDIQTSGQTTSDGGTGKTTAEMQTASTFLDAGWDFVGETANGTQDIWWILEGKDYPRLWWEESDL